MKKYQTNLNFIFISHIKIVVVNIFLNPKSRTNKNNKCQNINGKLFSALGGNTDTCYMPMYNQSSVYTNYSITNKELMNFLNDKPLIFQTSDVSGVRFNVFIFLTQ